MTTNESYTEGFHSVHHTVRQDWLAPGFYKRRLRELMRMSDPSGDRSC